MRRSRQRFQPGRLSLGAAPADSHYATRPASPRLLLPTLAFARLRSRTSTACCGDALYRRLVAAVPFRHGPRIPSAAGSLIATPFSLIPFTSWLINAGSTFAKAAGSLIAQVSSRTQSAGRLLACADVARAQQQYSPARCPLLRLTAGRMHAVGGRSGRGAGRVAQRRALTSCASFHRDEPQLPPRALARFRPRHRGVVGGRRGCSGSELTAHSARNPALLLAFAER